MSHSFFRQSYFSQRDAGSGSGRVPLDDRRVEGFPDTAEYPVRAHARRRVCRGRRETDWRSERDRCSPTTAVPRATKIHASSPTLSGSRTDDVLFTGLSGRDRLGSLRVSCKPVPFPTFYVNSETLVERIDLVLSGSLSHPSRTGESYDRDGDLGGTRRTDEEEGPSSPTPAQRVVSVFNVGLRPPRLRTSTLPQRLGGTRKK